VRFLRGSYSNVVGLPLFETANLLEGIGFPVRGGADPGHSDLGRADLEDD